MPEESRPRAGSDTQSTRLPPPPAWKKAPQGRPFQFETPAAFVAHQQALIKEKERLRAEFPHQGGCHPSGLGQQDSTTGVSSGPVVQTTSLNPPQNSFYSMEHVQRHPLAPQADQWQPTSASVPRESSPEVKHEDDRGPGNRDEFNFSAPREGVRKVSPPVHVIQPMQTEVGTSNGRVPSTPARFVTYQSEPSSEEEDSWDEDLWEEDWEMHPRIKKIPARPAQPKRLMFKVRGLIFTVSGRPIRPPFILTAGPNQDPVVPRLVQLPARVTESRIPGPVRHRHSSNRPSGQTFPYLSLPSPALRDSPVRVDSPVRLDAPVNVAGPQPPLSSPDAEVIINEAVRRAISQVTDIHAPMYKTILHQLENENTPLHESLRRQGVTREEFAKLEVRHRKLRNEHRKLRQDHLELRRNHRHLKKDYMTRLGVGSIDETLEEVDDEHNDQASRASDGGDDMPYLSKEHQKMYGVRYTHKTFPLGAVFRGARHVHYAHLKRAENPKKSRDAMCNALYEALGGSPGFTVPMFTESVSDEFRKLVEVVSKYVNLKDEMLALETEIKLQEKGTRDSSGSEYEA